jgi:ribosomal protein S18 acetylase RimI-like enzyme
VAGGRSGETAIDFSIRRATASDAPGILACLRAAFEPFRQQYTAGAFADTVLTAEALERRMAAMTLFVAMSDGGEFIGTAGCDIEGHIRGMAVLPEWEGRGVAKELLGAIERELQHCERISLDTTAPLERAIRFYERQGFTRSGKVTDFFGMDLFEFVKTIRR